MKRGGPLPRRTRLRPRSAKRVEKDRHLATVRQLVLARDGGCTFWLVMGRGPEVVIPLVDPPPRCSGRLHAHHLRRRSQGGPDTMDNLTTLCAAHHGWVHDHPALARRLGLLR